MRAIVVRKFAATPEVAEMPVPKPGPRDVLVQLEAAGVNPFDQKMAEGILEGAMPHDFPMILGVDGAGLVNAVGAEVTEFAVGDRVVGKFLTAPAGHGSFAEYSTVPANSTIVHIPDGIPTIAAAALPTAGGTAQDLVDAAKIEPDQTVLIVGATGGVGSFLVQLANTAGAHVIATARADVADRMTRLGAAATIDYTDGPISQQLAAAYPDGIDVLFDLIGPPESTAALLGAVRAGGAAYSIVGALNEDALRAKDIRGGNLQSGAKAAELARLLGRVADGDVVIPIDATIPLTEGLSAIGARGARGKTVLTI